MIDSKIFKINIIFLDIKIYINSFMEAIIFNLHHQEPEFFNSSD